MNMKNTMHVLRLSWDHTKSLFLLYMILEDDWNDCFVLILIGILNLKITKCMEILRNLMSFLAMPWL